MRRAFDIVFVLIVLAIVGFEAFDRLRPFDRPRLTGAPCRTLDWGQVRTLRFEDIGDSQSRARPRNVQVRTPTDGAAPARCRQVGGRVDCAVTGPAPVRVIAGDRVVYFQAGAGQTLTLRAQARGERIACVVSPAGSSPATRRW